MAAAVIIATTVSAIGGLYITRKKVSFDTLAEHHEVANPMVTIVATLYSVLLGFLVVCSFNRFDSCRTGVQAEANAIGDVFHFANGLPTDAKKLVQNDCLAYLNSVIDEEFPAMGVGKIGKLTRQCNEKLWTDTLSYVPKTPHESTIQEQVLTGVKATFERREDRIFQMNVGCWPILWGVLILGNVTIVAFTYFFAMKSLGSQMLMVGLLSFLLSINVYLVIDFSCPFDGPCSVSPEPLKAQRQNLRELL